MKINKNRYNQIIIEVEDQIDLDIEDVAWATQTVMKLQEIGIELIVDLEKGYINMTPNALKYLSTHKIHDSISALAIVLKSLPNRILANSFVKNNRFQYPARVFETRPEAETWLLN